MPAVPEDPYRTWMRSATSSLNQARVCVPMPTLPAAVTINRSPPDHRRAVVAEEYHTHLWPGLLVKAGVSRLPNDNPEALPPLWISLAST